MRKSWAISARSEPGARLCAMLPAENRSVSGVRLARTFKENRMRRLIYTAILALAAAPALVAQQAAPAPAARPARVTRPPLFFREEWKQTPKNDEHPVTQESIANSSLEPKLY